MAVNGEKRDPELFMIRYNLTDPAFHGNLEGAVCQSIDQSAGNGRIWA